MRNTSPLLKAFLVLLHQRFRHSLTGGSRIQVLPPSEHAHLWAHLSVFSLLLTRMSHWVPNSFKLVLFLTSEHMLSKCCHILSFWLEPRCRDTFRTLHRQGSFHFITLCYSIWLTSITQLPNSSVTVLLKLWSVSILILSSINIT